MIQDPEVEELVRDARAGSAEAFGRLVRLHQARVRMFLGRFIHDDAIVDDLAQETFLSAYRGLASFRGEARFSTWLLGIARREALMHLRERRSPVPLEAALAGWAAGSLEAAEETADDRRLAALRGCLGKLPPHGAEVLREFYFDRRPGAEIARRIGKRESAFWVLLLRLRQSLRQCIERAVAEART